MKQNIIFFLLIMELWLFRGILKGQSDSLFVHKHNTGSFTINAGIGASSIETTLNPESEFNLTSIASILDNKASSLINNIWTDNYKIIHQSPVYSVKGEYNITKRFSIGTGIAYQDVVGDGNNSPYEDAISRVNISVRCLYHFHPNHNYDDYIALRSGASVWTDSYNNPSKQTYFPLLSRSNFSLWSIQVLYGYRYFFTNTLGINFEIGIGSPIVYPNVRTGVSQS